MAKRQDPITKAFELFQKKKDYSAAAKAFGSLLDSGDLDLSVRSRIQMFHRLAMQLAAKNTEDPNYNSMSTVSCLMNDKKYDEAIKMIEKIDVSEDSALFLKAEIAAEKEDLESASQLLLKAISLEPENRGYAKNSPSFRPHLRDDLFEFLKQA